MKVYLRSLLALVCIAIAGNLYCADGNGRITIAKAQQRLNRLSPKAGLLLQKPALLLPPLTTAKELTSEKVQAQVKKMYRSLSLAYHPDKNKHEKAAERFKKINEAYHRLTTDADKEDPKPADPSCPNQPFQREENPEEALTHAFYLVKSAKTNQKKRSALANVKSCLDVIDLEKLSPKTLKTLNGIFTPISEPEFNIELATLLLDHGIPVRQEGIMIDTVLINPLTHSIAYPTKNTLQTIAFLISRGMSPNATDPRNKQTGFHIAAYCAYGRGGQSPAIIALLAELKGDPNLVDGYGALPLQVAAQQNIDEKKILPIVKALLDAKGDPELVSAHNMTPLKAAQQNQYPKLPNVIKLMKGEPVEEEKDDEQAIAAQKQKEESDRRDQMMREIQERQRQNEAQEKVQQEQQAAYKAKQAAEQQEKVEQIQERLQELKAQKRAEQEQHAAQQEKAKQPDNVVEDNRSALDKLLDDALDLLP